MQAVRVYREALDCLETKVLRGQTVTLDSLVTQAYLEVLDLLVQ